MKIDKKVYKYIDYELQHYEENKRELERLREEILDKGTTPADGQPRSNTTGNPTEQKAMKLVSSTALLKIERNLKAIDRVYNQLSEEYRRFFEYNYMKQVGIVKVCQEVGIEERTYYRWKDNIIYNVGMELGLL